MILRLSFFKGLCKKWDGLPILNFPLLLVGTDVEIVKVRVRIYIPLRLPMKDWNHSNFFHRLPSGDTFFAHEGFVNQAI